MYEARELGMGPAQATLDEIYESFKKFCDETDANRIAAEKAEAEKLAKKEHLIETLNELEVLLNGASPLDNANRIDAIIAEWNEGKSIMDGIEVKRFNQAFFKAQDLKKKTDAVEETETTVDESSRPELLERLQALADTDASETTPKHLHAIVREWEKLPLLEGEDPTLQAYNALRNKLSEKIAAFNENAQKVFEANTEKLKKIIERVKSFDENEDFLL